MFLVRMVVRVVVKLRLILTACVPGGGRGGGAMRESE